MHRTRILLAVLALFVLQSAANATLYLFDVSGNGGTGLLASNENHGINGTPGSGGEVGAGIFYDDVTNILEIHIGWGSGQGFTNLTGNATDHHIHGPTPNPAPAGFSDSVGVRIPLGSHPGFNNSGTNGGMNGTVLLDATQETELLAQRYYLNVHTQLNGPGEIRGHLVFGVPEPCGMMLVAIACAGFGIWRRKRT